MLEHRISEDNLATLIKTNQEIKRLEDILDKAKKQLKSEMETAGLTTLESNGTTITLSESDRTTVDKNAIETLILKGLGVCIKLEQTVDVNRLKLEVGRNITQDEFNKLVKVTPVKTMRIK